MLLVGIFYIRGDPHATLKSLQADPRVPVLVGHLIFEFGSPAPGVKPNG